MNTDDGVAGRAEPREAGGAAEPRDVDRSERSVPPRARGCGGGFLAGARAGAAVGTYLLVGGAVIAAVVDAVLGGAVGSGRRE